MLKTYILVLLLGSSILGASPVTLVRGGTPAAEIVVADDAGRVARAAAADLQKYLTRVSGAALIIRKESAPGTPGFAAIFVGQTKAALAAGIDASRLQEEGFAIRTRGERIFIVGADRTARDQGSFHGVSDFLERDLGVRWLWPGALGTVIPRRTTITVAAADRTGAPFMHIRRMRDAIANLNPSKLLRGMDALAMDENKRKSMAVDSGEWTSHMRLGGNVEASYGHAFLHWWDDYHEKHPDYFAMMPDGSRKWPWSNTERVKICFSNPAVQDQWMANARAYFKENPDSISFSATPNDNALQGHCTCPQCEAWDDPRGQKYSMNWMAGGKEVVRDHVSLSDRHFRFYNLLADRLAKEFPDKLLGAYAYNSWRNPPIRERQIRPNVMVGYVGPNSLGVSGDAWRKDLALWDEWAKLASKLFFRPNMLHGGHGMPLVYVHKLAADLRHRADNSMMGADFDSLIHHWSTQGLNYYVLAKLLWDPRLDVDALADDYIRAAFGPAAAEMKDYYAALEKHTDEIQRNTPDGVNGATKEFYATIPKLYPLPVVGQWRALLRQAKAKAPAGSDYARRIEWVALGLDYAELQSRLVGLTTKENPTAAEKQLIAKLGLEHEAWYRAHLYDWSVCPPLLRWSEPARLFGRVE